MKGILFVLLLLVPVLTKAQTASFTVSADTVCQDSCITFINTSTGTIDSIRWYIPGVTLANPHSDTINVCFTLAGNDTVKLYTFHAGMADSVTHVATIKRTPHPIYDWTCDCIHGTYLSYQWYDTGPIPGANDSSYWALGIYYVKVDSGGCFGYSDTLAVEGVNNIDYHNHKISLYPNPANSTLTISATFPIDYITMSNLLGQTITTPQPSQGMRGIQVDISDLPDGLYFIKVNGTEVRKFVKE